MEAVKSTDKYLEAMEVVMPSVYNTDRYLQAIRVAV
jgi:hypothetical protein